MCPAYIDIISYHECMFFVCEILYINVYIQTWNKKLKHNIAMCSIVSNYIVGKFVL